MKKIWGVTAVVSLAFLFCTVGAVEQNIVVFETGVSHVAMELLVFVLSCQYI